MNSEKNDNSKMVSKQFFGEIAPEEPKECAIMTLINNMSDNLTNQLCDAKLKFADATLDKDNWSMAKEREIKPTAGYFNTYPATVRRIIRLYNEKGEEGLITKR